MLELLVINDFKLCIVIYVRVFVCVRVDVYVYAYVHSYPHMHMYIISYHMSYVCVYVSAYVCQIRVIAVLMSSVLTFCFHLFIFCRTSSRKACSLVWGDQQKVCWVQSDIGWHDWQRCWANTNCRDMPRSKGPQLRAQKKQQKSDCCMVLLVHDRKRTILEHFRNQLWRT